VASACHVTSRIAISIGDVTGIGPEVALKALAHDLPEDDFRYVIFGPRALIEELNASLCLSLPLVPSSHEHGAGRVTLMESHPVGAPPCLPRGNAEAASAALSYLSQAAQFCLEGHADALVTAPVNKEAILRTGIPFVGQTEYLSALAKTTGTIMMLLGADERGRWLRVALATTHLPLRRVADAIDGQKIELAITLAARACGDLGLARARVGVCGLNPHAGEGGQLGDEELTTIEPAVARARRNGVDVFGPIAADTLFYHAFQGKFDAVVAMYHDQGLAPLKMIGFESGINWTLGLPFIRTSPDHGTAYDIAGKNTANPSSMRAAIHLAKTLAARGKP